MRHKISKIGIIGYGNVGRHLSQVFHKAKDLELVVFNRSRVSDDQNTEEINVTNQLEKLSDCGLIIIAVKDDAILPVLRSMKDVFPEEVIVCHCSGSTPTDVIAPYFKNYGVIYPLQTFSREKSINYSEIPIFISGSSVSVIQTLRKTSRYISPKIQEINDDQRIALHISAVFCCNYTNAMYAIGYKICADHNLNFDHLTPLIEETTDKIKTIPPNQAQTGPAVRGDWNTVERQETYLAKHDQRLTALYRQLADYINQNS